MKRKYFFLAAMLTVSGILEGIVGMVIKFGVLEPLGLYQDRTAMALPFVLLRDEGLQYLLSHPDGEETPVVTEPLATTPESTEPPQTTEPEETTPTEQTPVAEPETDVLERVLFIGDSRSCSLRDHARIPGGEYFCDVGMSVFNVWKKSLTDESFRNFHLSELLSDREYTCVTINLGLNEAGYPIDSLIAAYRELLGQVVKTQPQALIVLQGVMPVGRGWVKSAPYAAPENLAAINRRIQSLAEEYRVCYIDPTEKFGDEAGYLPDSMTWDGCHLYAKNTELWSQWFCEQVRKIKR